jgi:hypothetical protein
LSDESLGPLFQHPVEHHYLWVVAILLAIPAVIIAILGLVRGQLSAASAASALIVVPIFAYFLGNLVIMQESKKVAFCGSCHETMGPLIESAFQDNGSLASNHFRAGSVSSEDGCFVCHSGYGIWGNAEAKVAGVAHMIHTVTERYELPLPDPRPSTSTPVSIATPRRPAFAARRPIGSLWSRMRCSPVK